MGIHLILIIIPHNKSVQVKRPILSVMPHSDNKFKLTIMEKKVKKSRLDGVPAWALSLMTLVVIIILLVILEDPKNTGYSTIQIIGYTFCAILITGACFFICRAHPESVWYTIVICNAVGILGLISNIALTIVVPDYSTTLSEMILWGSIFVLSVIAAIIGAKIGQATTNPEKELPLS